MERLHQINPFVKRDSYSATTVWVYKFFTSLTWLLVVVTSVYYSIHKPDDDVLPRRSIWHQNRHFHTAFTMNMIIVSIYWILLFLFQIGYIWHLFSSNAEFVNAATAVGSHFILNNLFQFGFIMLFVRSRFYLAELILVLNFFNLTSLYLRHPAHPRFVHIPAVSGPLAWTFVALYWNGAIAVNAHTLAARILGNIAIWGILVFGGFFLVTFKDYTMGFELSILTAALGVAQFLRQIVALQWIFSFTIMATLFVATLAIAIPGFFGKELTFRRDAAPAEEDRERAPLLDDH